MNDIGSGPFDDVCGRSAWRGALPAPAPGDRPEGVLGVWRGPSPPPYMIAATRARLHHVDADADAMRLEHALMDVDAHAAAVLAETARLNSPKSALSMPGWPITFTPSLAGIVG